MASLEFREVVAATESDDWSRRWKAVNELGNRRDPRAVDALIKRALHDSNPHPRWRSIWAIAVVDPGAKEAFADLQAALQDRDTVVAMNAAVVLAFFGHVEGREHLLHTLASADDYRRWEAVFVIGKVADAHVVKALIGRLDFAVEPSDRVRGEAALALGRIKAKEALLPMLDALKGDPSAGVRRRAAMALAMLGDPAGIDPLSDIRSSEKDRDVVAAVEDALQKLGPR